jgi:nitrite reductase/ring-hydroxylating ferredoxin subunit
MSNLAKNSAGSAALKVMSRDIDEGLLPARIFSDPDIFDLEIERIFGRTWLYVGHESEIPNPGDYVIRNLALDSFIFVRGRDGKIRVLLNACRHRGNIVCRAERGNSPTFRCSYHGWTYDNTGTLLGVPVGRENYGDLLDRGDWGLHAAPRVSEYNGLVFANLDPDTPPLDEYLGDMKWYLDLMTGRSETGLEVIGAPHRWIINANWKFPADNFVADTHHFQSVHDSIQEIGAMPPGAGAPLLSRNLSLGNGHGINLGWLYTGEESSLLFLRGYPDSLVESMRRNLLPEQVRVLECGPAIAGNVFPNLGFMDVVNPDMEGGLRACLSLRAWQPIAVDRTEICSWFLVEKDTPEEFKERSYFAYMRGFGSAGALEQDDVSAWCGATLTAKGLMGRRLRQNIALGIANHQVDHEYPGRGEALFGNCSDTAWRDFYRTCLKYLMDSKGSSSPSSSARMLGR